MLVQGAAYSGAGTVVRASSAPAAGCCLKVLLSEWRVRFGASMLVPLQVAPARCCLRVLLSQCALWRGEWRVRFGACLLVPVQGAAAGCRCRVLLQGAAAGCCCRMLCCQSGLCALAVAWWCGCRLLLLEWRVRYGAGLPVPLHGAAAGWGCRVQLSKACLHLRKLGAVTGYCCQSAVCAIKLGCWRRCREWLRDVYGSVGVGP